VQLNGIDESQGPAPSKTAKNWEGEPKEKLEKKRGSKEIGIPHGNAIQLQKSKGDTEKSS